MKSLSLKLTPFIGDGNYNQEQYSLIYQANCLKLTPFIGDGNTFEISLF